VDCFYVARSESVYNIGTDPDPGEPIIYGSDRIQIWIRNIADKGFYVDSFLFLMGRLYHRRNQFVRFCSYVEFLPKICVWISSVLTVCRFHIDDTLQSCDKMAEFVDSEVNINLKALKKVNLTSVHWKRALFKIGPLGQNMSQTWFDTALFWENSLTIFSKTKSWILGHKHRSSMQVS